ncbi:MAG TPA: PilZ domain-containing protein [Gaiellales bacterium]|nr:PilZ domain-containing protein [Gaiellales bacterium]
MASGGNRFPELDRRRHFRVEGEWDVRVAALEQTGAVSEFDARALNISMSGVLLETLVKANLWVEKPMSITFPGAGTPVPAVVRRFLDYGDEGRTTTRWGVTFTDLTLEVKATWTRFLYSEARRLGQEAAHREFLARRAP